MAISVENRKFFQPLYLTPPLREFLSEFCNDGELKKLEWCPYTTRMSKQVTQLSLTNRATRLEVS